MDLADLAPLAQLGATGVLLAFIGWMLRVLGRGDWVSRRELDYQRADRDVRLAEKDHEIAEWRAAWTTSETARELHAVNERELIERLRVVDRVLDALQHARTPGMEGHGHGDAPPPAT